MSRQSDDLSSDDEFRPLPKHILETGSIKELIAFMEKEGLNINSEIVSVEDDEDELGPTFVLHLAVDVALESYHPDFVAYILSQGADCNKMDGKGLAPLHYAVLGSNTAAAQALVKAGADVNLQVCQTVPQTSWMLDGCSRSRIERDWKKVTSFPLHMATTTQLSAQKARPFPYYSLYNIVEGFYGPRNLDLIKLLLSSGANCNVLDEQGLAPLHYAVWADDVSAADVLLESGADINIQTRDEKVTPLFCVVSEKMLLFLLSKKPDQLITAFNGNTVLFHFLSLTLYHLSLTLLSDASDNDIPNNNNTSPLSCAFRKRDEVAIKILINSGCDPRPEILKINDRMSWIYTPEGETLIETMRQIANNPRKLFDLCRFKIRNILKTSIRMAVLDLPLPEKLRGAICLKDVTQDLNLADE